MGRPQPFTIWSGSQKWTRIGPPSPSPSRFREAPKWTRIGPPNPSRFGAALAKGCTSPPNPSRFGAAPKWTRIGPPQPFTIWSGSQMDKDWTHTKPSPSSGTRQHSLTESPLLLPAPARTASQKAHMRTRQHSLTESPIQTGTDSQKAHIQCCLFLHNSRQHSLTESSLPLPASARTASQKAHMRTRQQSLTESPIQTGTDSQKAHMQCCLFLHNSRQHSLTD